jgi:Domain of unknown function (DUF4347)
VAHEAEREAPTRDAEQAQSRGAEVRPGAVSRVVALQESAGNAAVSALLQGATLQRDWDQRQPAPPVLPIPWAAEGVYRYFSSEIDITAVTSEDFTDWLVSAFQGHEISIDGISDMVDKVLAALGPSKKIKHFWIDSHGSPGVMYLGTDRLSAASLPGHAAALGRLRGRFSATRGRVTLGGCNVAANAAGTALLSDLAALWNVPVRGGADTQRPLIGGIEGPVTRCTPGVGGAAPTCALE